MSYDKIFRPTKFVPKTMEHHQSIKAKTHCQYNTQLYTGTTATSTQNSTYP